MAKAQILKKAVDKLDDALKVGHDVAEVVPNTTSASTKKQIFQFAGSKAEIASQVSAFMANYELSQSLFGISPPDFEKWCETFEAAFSDAPVTTINSKVFGDKIKPWNRDRNNRPKIKILNKLGESLNYIWAEFYPDWDNKEEAYFITGTPFMCVQQIMNIWNTKQIIENGDFAQLLGYPPSEYIKKRPTIGLSVVFVLWNYKSPQIWRITGEKKKKPKRAQISIPFAKRSSLKYEAIRAALGGSTGLNWGDSNCIAWVADDLDNYPKNKKGMPQMQCKGNSYNDAKSRLKNLLQFTDAKVVSMSGNKLDKEEDLNPTNNSNQVIKMFPIFMYVMNSRILNFSSPEGRETRLGRLDTNKNRIELYHETKPRDFDRRLDELFKWD